MDMHIHRDFHELAVLAEGHLETTLSNGNRLNAEKGDILIYPKGLSHRPWFDGDGVLHMLLFRWNGGEEISRIEAPEVRVDSGRIRHQLEWLLEVLPCRDQHDLDALESISRTVLHELGRLPAATADDEQMLARVQTYMRSNLTRKISLEDLALAAGLSKYYFLRRFKKLTGKTPMTALTEFRVETATELIRQTQLSMDSIAMQVGLADASHLSHCFVRVTGQSPSQWRH
jgi:AraC-like DNA-binding protein